MDENHQGVEEVFEVNGNPEYPSPPPTPPHPSILYVTVSKDLAGQTMHRQRSDNELQELKEAEIVLNNFIKYYDDYRRLLHAELEFEAELRHRTETCLKPKVLEEPPAPIVVNQLNPTIIKTVAKRKPGQRGPDRIPRKKRGCTRD